MGVQERHLTPLLEFMSNSCSMTPPRGQQAETGFRREVRLSLFLLRLVPAFGVLFRFLTFFSHPAVKDIKFRQTFFLLNLSEKYVFLLQTYVRTLVAKTRSFSS